MQPKPDAEKRLTGTYRKDRARAAPKSDGAGNPPRMPSGLTPEEQKIWRRLVNLPSLRKRLAPDDVEILLALVQSINLRDLAYAALTSEGLSAPDERKLPRKSPHFQIWRQAATEVRLLLARLGLSPRDRQTLRAPAEDKEPSEFEKYLARSPRGRE